MNRRQVLGSAVGLALTGSVLAQSSQAKVKIIELEKLKNVWDDAEFRYQNIACLVVRVAAPEKPSDKPNPRLLEVGKNFYVAYSRVCTHTGCQTQLPNNLRQLECGCHGSIFNAADGSIKADPLRGVKLEVVDGSLFAVGWLD
jgi:cytochrome b6-f complex iron-sulfur subunit